jgi:RNA polymerase sigma-70 factor (ECF subfamily)
VHTGWADEALWRGLLARDTSALEALIARYSRELTYFVRTVLDGVGTAQDAEECISDLFVAAWEEVKGFDPARGSFRTWLTMRAKFLALDRRRQIQRRQAVLVGASLGDGEMGERDVARAGPSGEFLAGSALRPEPAENMDRLLERREQQQQLRQALEQLPELDRLVVYLRYFRLASTDEIATQTGLTKRAVDTRLWRARKLLREAIEAMEQVDGDLPPAPARPAQKGRPAGR